MIGPLRGVKILPFPRKGPDIAGASVLNCGHQRKEVVQHMPDNQYGTLEVVGR